MRKPNSFIKYLKIINISINSLLEKNLNKLKFVNLIKLAQSNKIFLSIVASVILFLSYLSIPHVYIQTEISKELNNKLNNKFELELNFSNKINYKFFPRPHFVSYNSSIIHNEKKISEIKNLKIFVSLKNLFSLKKLKINEVVMEDTNFNLNKENYNFFITVLDNDFENSSLKIINGNVFFRNINDEVLFINKIIKIKYFFDKKELKNILYSENEIFNIPYSVKLFNDKSKQKIYSKLNFNFLKLQIENFYTYKDDIKLGLADIIFNKHQSSIKYSINQNLFEFIFFNKLDNPKFSYKGKFNFKPFYSSIKGDTKELNLSYLFNSNAIISELLKTEIFNNKNINFNLNVKADKIKNFNNFTGIFLNSKIQEGLIDIDNTIFGWKNYAIFEIFNSLIYVKNGELVLDGTANINVVENNEIYKFLLTPKKFRKKIKKIDLNYTYNFSQKLISLNDIRIDGRLSANVSKIINNISIKNDNLKNKIYFKNLLNEALKAYAG